MRRTLAWIGVALWAVSWFVPVIKGQETVDTVKSLSSGGEGDGPPGWQAFHTAWDLLTKHSDKWKDKLLGLTSLTNAVFLVGSVCVLRNRASRGMGMLLVACTALDLSWVYLNLDDFGDLRAGYWLWVASFALLGIGLMPRKA